MNSSIIRFPAASCVAPRRAETSFAFSAQASIPPRMHSISLSETAVALPAMRRTRRLWRSAACLAGAVLCVGAALAMPLQARAQSVAATPASEKVTRMLTTSGTGEVKVAPDYVTFNVGIRVQDKDLAKATTDEAAKTKAILAALTRSGVEAKHIQTDRIQIQPIYRTRDGDEVLDCYRVERMASVRLENPGKFDEVLTAVLAAGANTVDSIALCSKELRKHRDTARSLAVKHAREKAGAIAKDMGCLVGPPITVGENTWGGPYFNSYNYNRQTNNYMQAQTTSAPGGGETGEGADSAAFSTGTLSITANINVVFELVPDPAAWK